MGPRYDSKNAVIGTCWAGVSSTRMIHVSGRAVNCSAVAGSWEPDVLLRQPEKLTLTLIISKVSLNYCLREKPALMYISQTAQ